MPVKIQSNGTILNMNLVALRLCYFNGLEIIDTKWGMEPLVTF